MFQIFRRHQKVLLGGIAVIAIGSMALSAILPLFYDQKESKAVLQELIRNPEDALVKLFNHSLDASNREVIFPEALFTETIINTGIYKQVYHLNPKQINEELDLAFQKIVSDQPKDVIPGSTYYQIVAQISPKMGALIQKMKHAEGIGHEAKLELMAEFFQEKSKFPNPLMYQYIQAISNGKLLIEPDELSFFGLKNPEDFWGQTLVKASAHFFISFLKDEAKNQKPQILVSQLAQRLKTFYNMNIHPNQFFIACGIAPESGLEVLKILSAFRSTGEKLKQDILLDSLTYQSFQNFAQKQIPVHVYSFSKDLEPKSLEEVWLLNTYKNLKHPLSFDKYEIKIRSLEKNKALQKLPKKQQYAQALKGYQELASLMPYAFKQDIETDKQKLEAIKALQGKSKDLFESYLQKAFLKEDPLFFQKILQDVPVKTQILCLVKEGKKSPIPGFGALKDLKQELDMLPVNTPVMFDIADQFIHEIEIVAKNIDQQALSYQDALESGYLKELVKQDLEISYKELIKKQPSKFLNNSNKMKTLDEAYYDVLEMSAKDFKKKLAQCQGTQDDVPSHLLVKAYPKLVLKEFLKKGIEHEDFRIVKQVGYLHRADSIDPSVIKLFQEGQNQFSEIVQDMSGSYCIYEKTGPVETAELVCDKSAIDILAKEKLSQFFSQKKDN